MELIVVENVIEMEHDVTLEKMKRRNVYGNSV